jgi:hypothetical protein
MKKLLVLSSFIVFGFAAAYAQAPATKASVATTPAATLATPATPAAPATPAVSADTDASAEATRVKATAGKKECSAEEKKACGSKAEGKKSCCSSKTEAKKD